MTMQPEATVSEPTPRVAWQGLAFVLLGLALGALLISAGSTVYAVQGGVATFASLLPLGYAFGAGMVATVNPCGVLLLPSLVAYYLGRGEAVALSGPQRAGKALLLGLMATLGFVTLFSIVGLAIGAGGYALAAAFPIGGLLVGMGLAGLGVWLALSGRGLGILLASRAMEHVHLRDDLRSLFLFGVAYAVTSLACTLPIFLVVASSALAASGPVQAAGQFVSYALGMGSVLTVVILGAAFFQSTVHRSLRGLVPYVHRLAASFLIGAGLFVMNYWLTTGGLLG
ncbi:MAG: cytochrome c biogenesis protein CcdA [Chloroflexi bacterium]|nr:cytochrome c biogenesis protein CcdA [Chloroflexota bacterium]